MALARDSQNENVIPVIDLSSSTSNSKQDVAKQLVEAAATHGFVFIKNLGHDISVSDSDRAFDIVSV
jgi:isopenicillin N synthase-like dioxygenase